MTARNLRRHTDPAMRRIAAERGMMGRIAKALDLRHETVSVWKRVPLEYVFTVAEVSAIAPEILRPDFFSNDPARALMRPALVVYAAKMKPRAKLGVPRHL